MPGFEYLYRLFPPLALCAVLLGPAGCGGDDGPTAPDHRHEAPAWVWVYHGSANALRVYHSETGALQARFTASAHPMMHIQRAGPAAEPTIWMAGNNTAYAFTAGFHLHGDHADMQVPQVHLTVPVGQGPVHMGAAPDGRRVAFANDGDHTVSVIDVETGTVRTVSHGSGHSAALLTGNYLLTTAATSMPEAWAKIVDIDRDQVMTTVTIGAGAHGDAYYAAGQMAFVACAGAIYVIDVPARAVTDSLQYTQPGRTNFLYHGRSSPYAVGLHRTDAGTSDRILRLDMAGRRLEYIAIPGATLDWKIMNGTFALSADGGVAVLADLQKASIYHVDLATGNITTLTAPGVAAAVATNSDGSRVWALSDGRVSRIHVDENETESAFDVDAGTDWIYVTSCHGEVVDTHDD